jgi:hypothetical protein
VLQIGAVEGFGIQEDRHGIVERDAVFRGVDLGLPRVPLEHLFSIYGMRRGMLESERAIQSARSEALPQPDIQLADQSHPSSETRLRVVANRSNLPNPGRESFAALKYSVRPSNENAPPD